MPERPEIVCLCGSMRFAPEMVAATRELSLAGVIVVAPGVLPGPPGHQPGDELTHDQQVALGELHLRKIDLADRILVVNPGGYLGESTRREIAYAHATGTPVTYTDPA